MSIRLLWWRVFYFLRSVKECNIVHQYILLLSKKEKRPRKQNEYTDNFRKQCYCHHFPFFFLSFNNLFFFCKIHFLPNKMCLSQKKKNNFTIQSNPPKKVKQKAIISSTFSCELCEPCWFSRVSPNFLFGLLFGWLYQNNIRYNTPHSLVLFISWVFLFHFSFWMNDSQF